MKKFLLKMCDCFFLLRIFLLVPVWTTVILGWITSYPHTAVGGYVTKTTTFTQEKPMWIALLGFSFIVAACFVLNQIRDIESDRINNKLFILPHGLISIRTAWICALICSLMGLLICVVYFDTLMLILFIIGLLLGIAYNFPPFTLKNTPLGGVGANLIGHGMITYLVGWYAAHYGNTLDSPTIINGLLASCALGFAHAAVFLTTTIPDTEGDRAIGKNTFSVVYGEKKTAVMAAIFCGLTLVLSITFEYNRWIMILQSCISLILFISFAIKTNSDYAFKTFRWPVFLLSALVVLYVPLYGVITLIDLYICRIYYKLRFNYTYPTFFKK